LSTSPQHMEITAAHSPAFSPDEVSTEPARHHSMSIVQWLYWPQTDGKHTFTFLQFLSGKATLVPTHCCCLPGYITRPRVDNSPSLHLWCTTSTQPVSPSLVQSCCMAALLSAEPQPILTRHCGSAAHWRPASPSALQAVVKPRLSKQGSHLPLPQAGCTSSCSPPLKALQLPIAAPRTQCHLISAPPDAPDAMLAPHMASATTALARASLKPP
jgi:hypothetical protein